MNNEWTGKNIEKNLSKKSKKNSKNKSENAACEQKTTSESKFFPFFSHYLKNRVQKIHATKPLPFSLHFSCFGVTKITTPI